VVAFTLLCLALAVVIADVEGKEDHGALTPPGGQRQHPEHIPQPARLILTDNGTFTLVI
jgi:hypothetical protein